MFHFRRTPIMLIMPHYYGNYLSKNERVIIRNKMFPHFLLI